VTAKGTYRLITNGRRLKLVSSPIQEADAAIAKN